MGSEQEYEALFKKLDAGQKFELAKEENKLKRDKKAVKINRFGDYSLAEIIAFITRVVGNPPIKLYEEGGWYTVIYPTEEEQAKLLALQGKKIVGAGEIKVVKKELRLSVEEVFTFLIEGVRMRERAQLGDIPPRRHFSPVREITTKETAKTPFDGKTLYSPPLSPKNSAAQNMQGKQVQWNQNKPQTKIPSPATSPRNNNQGKGKGKGKGKGGFQNQQWGQNNFNNGGNWKGGHQNHFQHNQVPFNGFHNHHHNFQGWNQGFQPNYFQPGFQNQWGQTPFVPPQNYFQGFHAHNHWNQNNHQFNGKGKGKGNFTNPPNYFGRGKGQHNTQNPPAANPPNAVGGTAPPTTV